MKRIVFFTLMLATLLSCTKTIDFDNEELAHLVVVNSMIGTDHTFSALLTQSTSILTDGQTNPPLEGTMDLYEDGTLLRQFPSQRGGFSAFDIQPEAGKNYRMVISANGQQVEAETNIPLQTEVVSIDTMSTKTKFNSIITNYKLKIKDAVGEDYYRLFIVHEMLTMIPKENDTIRYLPYINYDRVQSEDPVFKSVYNNFGDELIDFGPENDYAIFPDTYFQGKEYTLQFTTYSYYRNPANPNFGGGGYGNPNNPDPASGPQKIFDRTTIHIQHLSKDLYTYLKYLELYTYYSSNPFSEPVAVYSNVKNGVGIFAGFNDEAKFIYEDTYIPYSMDTIKVEEVQGYSYGY